MDYSKTVNLPKTDFPMKANLPNREPEMLKFWEEEDIYNKILNERKDADLYILHDGPPYANGHIHIGHALNKLLKDFIIKNKTMKGFKVPYVPGWDCHGLPIELNVFKKLKNARSKSKVELRNGCREYAQKFVDIQADEFKRLGIFGDFENPYKTMTKQYESTIIDVFGKIFKEGYIYRSKKPIYWCPNCVTALAEAEVEYDDHKSPSIYVKFKVDPGSCKIDGVNTENLFVVIWTTTPWTLPANLAVSLNPDIEYSVYKNNDEFYLIANGLAGQMQETAGISLNDPIPVAMDVIEKMIVKHPFIDRESKVLFGKHVTLEQGTGVVHTAPGHGHDDYIIGLKYGLEAYCPVDDRGNYTEEFMEMEGVNVFNANDRILEILEEKNALIHTKEIEHSYPHCWRCKKPLIFRSTEQWFFNIDHKELREKGLKTVDEVEWIPSWGEARFRSMAETRPDWCLSRQRTWGVPIPSFKCKKCDKNLMSPESVEYFATLAKEKGIDIWFEDSIEDLLPKGTKCSCGSTEFEKEFDILDVWFDSGVSHFVVLENWDNHRWPADLYLEGSDQHRGWFQSSLWPSLAAKGAAPYKAVLTHGFVLDEKGKAMSKSVGNVIPPEKLIKQFGADILRLWVSSEDYRSDLRIGMDMIKQVADSYRKIRNTFKFILGNLSDFDEKFIVDYENLAEVDKWILVKLYNLSEKVKESYDNFEFHMVYRHIINFCAVELSSIYFDISKDVLYIEKADSERRRSNQTALNYISQTLVRLIAPILSFTSEEIWKFMGNEDSIHTKGYYELDEKFKNTDLEERMEKIVNVKKDLLKALEESRKEKIIKSSLESDIKLFIDDSKTNEYLIGMKDELRQFFQVAKIEILSEKEENLINFGDCHISITKTDGVKCIRCWNFTEDVGVDSSHPEICGRCASILEDI